MRSEDWISTTFLPSGAKIKRPSFYALTSKPQPDKSDRMWSDFCSFKSRRIDGSTKFYSTVIRPTTMKLSPRQLLNGQLKTTIDFARLKSYTKNTNVTVTARSKA